MRGRKNDNWYLAPSLASLFIGLGWVVAFLVGDPSRNSWYLNLTLPSFMPPDALFGIAWGMVYGLLGVVAARLYLGPDVAERRTSLILFSAQLGCNYLWPVLFFRAHMLLPALVLLAVIILLSAAVVFLAAKVDGLAVLLMLPYIAWLGFAFRLNWTIWASNSVS